MEDAEIIEKLTMFGLTRQDAAVYLCLLKNGELTGYEAAKLTGISRSNVYGALAGLVERGAAYLIEGSSAKYTPLPVEEFCENYIARLGELSGWLAGHVPVRPENVEGYITVKGSRHVRDKMRHMLVNAAQRVYLSAPSRYVESWGGELGQLAGRKIKVVIITEQIPRGLPEEGVTVYLSGEPKGGRLRLIIDSAQVLTGEITDGGGDNCLYCAQPNFVDVFKEAMRNEIKLIQLKGQEK